jgi:LuxR family maltose regulon positive regulatory protein
MSIAVAGAGQQARAEQLLAEAHSLCNWSDDGMGAMRARLTRTRAIVHRREKRSPVLDEPLTRRELEVLYRLQGPESLRELGEQLFVSRNTVKTLAATVYRKLGVHSREDAVRSARSNGLLDSGDRIHPGEFPGGR